MDDITLAERNLSGRCGLCGTDTIQHSIGSRVEGGSLAINLCSGCTRDIRHKLIDIDKEDRTSYLIYLGIVRGNN